MLEHELEDAAQHGAEAAFTSLLKDANFRQLVGCLATVYAVTNNRSTSIDQRSFRAAKERITTFCARTSGWSAKLSRDTRNGSWNRGQVHPNETRSEWNGAMERLGGRGGRVRARRGDEPSEATISRPPPGSESETADKVPVGLPSALKRVGARDKSCCPGCSRPAKAVWSLANRTVCPRCVRQVAREMNDK